MSRKPAAYSITGAPKSLQDDVRSREVRYLFSMGIRTACFLLAIFVAEGVLRWLLIAAAVLLPYVAVVLANAGRERRGKAPAAYVPDGKLQLPQNSTQIPLWVPGQGHGKSSEEVRPPH